MTGRWITTPSEVDMATCAGRHIFTRELAESHQRCHLEQIASVRPHSPISASSSEDPKALRSKRPVCAVRWLDSVKKGRAVAFTGNLLEATKRPSTKWR